MTKEINEIDVFEAEISHSIVNVEYELNGSPVKQQIKKTNLLQHIVDNNLNYMFDGIDDYIALDVESYLEDNLTYVVENYLEESFKEK